MNNQTITVPSFSGNFNDVSGNVSNNTNEGLITCEIDDVNGSKYFNIIKNNENMDELKTNISDSRELYIYFFGSNVIESMFSDYIFKNKNQFTFLKFIRKFSNY